MWFSIIFYFFSNVIPFWQKLWKERHFEQKSQCGIVCSSWFSTTKKIPFSESSSWKKMRHGAVVVAAMAARRALKRKPSRSLRFSMVTSSFANLCSASCCSHGGSLSSSAHWQLIWHGPLNKWTHILPHDDAILYSKYSTTACACLFTAALIP